MKKERRRRESSFIDSLPYRKKLEKENNGRKVFFLKKLFGIPREHITLSPSFLTFLSSLLTAEFHLPYTRPGIKEGRKKGGEEGILKVPPFLSLPAEGWGRKEKGRVGGRIPN